MKDLFLALASVLCGAVSVPLFAFLFRVYREYQRLVKTGLDTYL